MMKKSNRSFVGILVGMLLLRCYTADAQIEQALDSVLALRLDSIVRQELGRQDIIGMSVGVVQQGKVAFLKGYGFSDWENRVPVSIESEFRWASLSKSLTSIAALKLKEQGLLNLDTMARAYVLLTAKSERDWALQRNGPALSGLEEKNGCLPTRYACLECRRCC